MGVGVGVGVGEGEGEGESELDAEMSRMERSLVVRVWEQNRRQAELNTRFVSKEERELHRLARERIYDSMLVSIRMPDGVRLEGRFNPHEGASPCLWTLPSDTARLPLGRCRCRLTTHHSPLVI